MIGEVHWQALSNKAVASAPPALRTVRAVRPRGRRLAWTLRSWSLGRITPGSVMVTDSGYGGSRRGGAAGGQAVRQAVRQLRWTVIDGSPRNHGEAYGAALGGSGIGYLTWANEMDRVPAVVTGMLRSLPRKGI